MQPSDVKKTGSITVTLSKSLEAIEKIKRKKENIKSEVKEIIKLINYMEELNMDITCVLSFQGTNKNVEY